MTNLYFCVFAQLSYLRVLMVLYSLVVEIIQR